MAYKDGTDLILGLMEGQTFKPFGHSDSCKISDSTETGERKTKEARTGKFKEKYIKSALEKEYAIDNLGILALHTRISERQTLDHEVTVSEVKDIIDDAIYYAEKRTLAHFVDVIVNKRYDENDMVILREKDFMH